MDAHMIGLEVFVDFTEGKIHYTTSPSPRDSRLCVDQHRPLDHFFGIERGQTKNGARRVTARVGNKSGLSDVFSVYLSQAIDCRT